MISMSTVGVRLVYFLPQVVGQLFGLLSDRLEQLGELSPTEFEEARDLLLGSIQFRLGIGVDLNLLTWLNFLVDVLSAFVDSGGEHGAQKHEALLEVTA